MTWPILVVATLCAIFVAIVFFAFGVRRLAIVLPVQVAVSFGLAYAAAEGFTEAPVDARVVWTCLGAAIAIPAIWTVLTVILGPPLERRRMARARGGTDR